MRGRAGWAAARNNRVFRVSAREGEFVLKVSPGDQPGLTYERSLMRTETEFCTLGSAVAPVPQVVHTDFSRSLVDGDVILATCLPGAPLYGRSDVDRPRIRRQLGCAVAALHDVTGPGFGYPQLGLHETWTEAFFGMFDAVLADADRYGVPLPEIRSLVHRHAARFDEVARPALVHFDLWDGNVLADETGLVDGERAFWGDPVADFVSLALFREIDADFLTGYGAELADRVRLAAPPNR